MDTLTVISTTIASLGGFELVKALVNRRTDRRVASARASTEEFHSLREYNEFLQQQLRNAEQRVADQSALLRQLDAEILRLTNQKNAVETELLLKRCEIRNCPARRPPSNY